MTESQEDDATQELSVNRIFKYTSIKEIFNEITGKSSDVLNLFIDKKREPEIVLVYSASGGCGKTTLATGLCGCLAKNYKRVLYINASYIHTFQRLLDNPVSISSSDVYSNLLKGEDSIYKEIKHTIRKESFYYLPPFKTSLLSLGINYSLFGKIAREAKESNEYDYVVLDADSQFDEDAAEFLSMASKVIIVTAQSEASVFATNALIHNLNGINSEKYIFVCNDFNKNRDNALVSSNIKPMYSVREFVEHLEHYDQMRVKDLEKVSGIQKTAFLII
jgi:cellulose biosynthesis protein BcsQ